MKQMRSSYIVVGQDKEFVYIKDCNGQISVTNDAEAVVDKLLPAYFGKRIMYCDSDGCWDELCHDGTRFTDFNPGHPPIGPLSL